jgi:aspartyl-tRNA(Asn)/glutamyl-tRNA(Gln) amidotransferase subunit A
MSWNDGTLFASIAEIGRLFRSGELSPVELTRAQLARIEKLNPLLNAFITVSDERALRAAKEAEAALSMRSKKAVEDLGPLHGIPISLKDNLYTKDVRTTGGSKILKNFVPQQDAAVVALLKKAGAVILGKTNLHEFAYGTTSNNPFYGAVRNPWDVERISGGSTGGSAAGLAAGLGYASVGTDTGGSIRIPAALCGVVGLKPGLRRVSVDGVIPLSTTLDVVGPIARSVDDAALLFDVVAARENGERSFRPPEKAAESFVGWKLGVPRTFFLELMSPEVVKAFENAVRILKNGGADVKEVDVPLLQETEQAGNEIAWAEATLYHEECGWYPHRAAEYGEDVALRLEMGTKVKATTYLRALSMRAKIIEGMSQVFRQQGVDALIAPTTPMAAPKIGEETTTIDGKGHATRGLLLRLNRPANVTGMPAISVPCGRTDEGLPLGLQLMGPMRGEAELLRLAAEFERACPLPERALDAKLSGAAVTN